MLFNWKKLAPLGKLIIIGGIYCCLFTNTYSEASSPAGIIHFPVKNATEGQSIFLEAKIEDQPIRQVQYVRIYFRNKGESDYRFIEMEDQLGNFTGEIPAAVVKAPGVEYLILALFTDRSMGTSPSSNPYYTPHEVTVTPGALQEIEPASEQTTARQITSESGVDLQTNILSPEPEERVSDDDVVIAVSFLGETEKLDVSSIKLLIDGKNFTSAAEITENMLTYVPGKLSSGSHQIQIQLSDKNNNQFPNVTWRFYVDGTEDAQKKAGRKLPFSGKVYAEFRNEKFSDSTYTMTNFGGNIYGKFGPIKYNSRVFITSREDPAFQSRNRMFIEVGTSWIGVKFGDTNPTFNELMLWGRRVRGIEAYIKLGFINVEFVTGETNRKIEGLHYENSVTSPDSIGYYYHPTIAGKTVFSSTGIYKYGTYKQTLMAIRPSIGGGKNFQFGLNLVKVKDDPESIEYSTKPKDNVVFGPDILLAFDNHRIEFKASAAFSLLADDISTGALTDENFDSLDFDIPFNPADYEDYFVLNTSLVPLDPTGLTSLAYQGSFKFNYFNNFINVVYKSIGSEYQALANNFLRKDIEGFSVFDRIRLFRNQIYLNLGYEKYLEELSTEDDGEDATAPNDFAAINVGVSLLPQKKYLPRLNVNWKSYDRNNGLDTLIAPSALNYQNNDLSFQLGYDIQLMGMNHTFSISHITNDRIDGFKRTYSDFENNIQMYSVRTNYQIPLTTVITYAKNNNVAGGGSYGFKYDMFGVSGTYRLLNNNLTLTAGFTSTNAVGSNTTLQTIDDLGNPLTVPTMETTNYTDYKRTAFNFGGNFKFLKKHSILWDWSIIDFNDKITKKYTNNYFRIRYQMRY